MDLVVSDVCGPMQTETIGKKRYFVTFIDAHSRYCEVKFIRNKSDVTEETIQFVERMKTQLRLKPKIFRTDRGGEYLDEKLQRYLKNEGIKPECTVGYCPEQNGIAERKNRTLMEAARAMLKEAGMPANHWAEAVNTANHATNRIVNDKTGKSPYEIMFGEIPRWNEMQKFGTEAFVMIPKEKRRKLDDKSKKMKFVGYDERSKGLRMTDGRQVIVSREVHFLKNGDKSKKSVDEDNNFQNFVDFSSDEEDVMENPIHQQLEEDDEDFVSANEDQEEDSDASSIEEESPATPEPRRSTRNNIGTLPSYLRDYVVDRHDAMKAEEENDPRSYKEAVQSVNATQWTNAMQEELDAIQDNETWDMVDLPQGRKAIGSRWVFKTKYDNSGNLVKRKARLVAQGFSQKQGIDYEDVFAPVARGVTMRMLLSMAGERKYIVKQYDVKTAFLNGTLKEEIFMKPPEGLDTKGKVCKLNKSLYGLKQAARVWNHMLHESLIKRGFEQNETDNCLYLFKSGREVVHLLIHVDDILAATNNEKLLDQIMNDVGQDFELKCVGEAKEYLGIDLERDANGHFDISQSKFIQSIIDAAGQQDAKASKFPIDTGYYKLQGKELGTNETYRKLIGMLLYASTNTRPDISASVSILSQRVANPRDIDMNEVKRVIRYLKGTKNMKLKLSEEIDSGKLVTYADSDWAEDRRDRKSISGWYVLMNGGAVAWSSKKQDVVALSSAEAEYVALTEAVKEAIWIKRIAQHFGYDSNEPAKLLTDSQSAMAIVSNEKFSNRTKHIDTKYHFIKDLKEKGLIELEYHPTATNVADMMTKPLGGNKIAQLRSLAKLQQEPTN